MTEPEPADISAAAFAPLDLEGMSPQELSDRLDSEGETVRAIRDDRQREMAETALNKRWRAYLTAWHTAESIEVNKRAKP